MLASTCWPGLLARPPQVRGQGVMEGSVRVGNVGKDEKEVCWGEKRIVY